MAFVVLIRSAALSHKKVLFRVCVSLCVSLLPFARGLGALRVDVKEVVNHAKYVRGVGAALAEATAVVLRVHGRIRQSRQGVQVLGFPHYVDACEQVCQGI